MLLFCCSKFLASLCSRLCSANTNISRSTIHSWVDTSSLCTGKETSWKGGGREGGREEVREGGREGGRGEDEGERKGWVT